MCAQIWVRVCGGNGYKTTSLSAGPHYTANAWCLVQDDFRVAITGLEAGRCDTAPAINLDASRETVAYGLEFDPTAGTGLPNLFHNTIAFNIQAARVNG
jgi:hypothetical protein